MCVCVCVCVCVYVCVHQRVCADFQCIDGVGMWPNTAHTILEPFALTLPPSHPDSISFTGSPSPSPSPSISPHQPHPRENLYLCMSVVMTVCESDGQNARTQFLFECVKGVGVGTCVSGYVWVVADVCV